MNPQTSLRPSIFQLQNSQFQRLAILFVLGRAISYMIVRSHHLKPSSWRASERALWTKTVQFRIGTSRRPCLALWIKVSREKSSKYNESKYPARVFADYIDFVKIVDRTRCQLENKCNVKPRIFMTILRLSKFYSPQLLGVFQ